MPAIKHIKLDLGVQPESLAPSNIVVESGPVEYASAMGTPDCIEGVGGEYYEEESTLQSAAQLMGRGGNPSYRRKKKMKKTFSFAFFVLTVLFFEVLFKMSTGTDALEVWSQPVTLCGIMLFTHMLRAFGTVPLIKFVSQRPLTFSRNISKLFFAMIDCFVELFSHY